MEQMQRTNYRKITNKLFASLKKKENISALTKKYNLKWQKQKISLRPSNRSFSKLPLKIFTVLELNSQKKVHLLTKLLEKKMLVTLSNFLVKKQLI